MISVSELSDMPMAGRKWGSMELRQLRYFIGIVEAGSMTRAAEVLCVAQPSLSAHIARMEEELDVALFDRLPRGIQPTQAGMTLYQRAQSILVSVDQAASEVRGVTGRVAGKVHLGLTGTINSALAVPLIRAAETRHPDLQIVISEAMSGFVQEWVISGKVDVGVIYSAENLSGVRSDRLFVEDLIGITSPGDPVESFEDLLEARPFVLPGREHGLRRTIDDHLGSRTSRLRVKYEVASYQNIVDFTKAGFGASILPRHAVSRHLADGSLKSVQFRSQPATRVASVVTSTTRPKSALMVSLEAVLRDVVSDLISEGCLEGVRL